MKNQEYRNAPQITEVCRQILIGSIFGDGSLRVNGKNCYFEETHSIKQRNYLLWKNKYLKVFSTRLKIKLLRNKKLNKNYKQFVLRTLNSQLLSDYYKSFYNKRRKIINTNILNQLNKLGLVVWYLDDGHITVLENIIKLSTNSYSYAEHLKMKKWFMTKFNICPKIKQVNGGYELFFNREDSETLLLIFRRVFKIFDVPLCMWYKLGRFWKGNLNKFENARKKKNEYKREWRRKKSEIKRREKFKKLKLLLNEIRKLYWGEELSLFMVAKRLGYKSHVTVLKIMKKYNIPRRTLSEACSGVKNGFYGKHHSPKTKIELSKKIKAIRGLK